MKKKRAKEPRETFVGFRPVIFDTGKQNPKKSRRDAKLLIRKLGREHQ